MANPSDINFGGELTDSAVAAAESLALRDFNDVANDFDPTVSGQDAAVGSTMRTADHAKSWVKTGTGNAQWTPIHAVTKSFAATGRTSIAATDVIPTGLACDTLGGFRMEIRGALSVLPSGNTNVRFDFNVNGTATSSKAFSKVGLMGAAGAVEQAHSSLLYVPTSEIYVCIEATPLGVKSTLTGQQMVHAIARASAGSYSSWVGVVTKTDAGAQPEITNPGITIDGGTGVTLDALEVTITR